MVSPKSTLRTWVEESPLRAAPPPFPPNANGPRALAHTRPREATRRGRRPKRWKGRGAMRAAQATWTSQDEVAFGPSTLCTRLEASLAPSFQSPHSRRSRSHLPAPRSRIPRGPRPLPSGGHVTKGTPGFSHFRQGEALKPRIRQSLQTRRLRHCKCRRLPFFCRAA